MLNNPAPSINLHPLLLVGVSILAAALACAPGTTQDIDTDADAVQTSVAATLTALSPGTPTDPPPTASPTTRAPTDTPTTEPPSPTPPGGLSLNCDATYQRVRLEAGAEGRTLYIDEWQGDGWRQGWSYNAGDPQIQEVEETAGAYSFGGCKHLIVVPVLFSGTGSVLELRVFRWDPDSPIEVYANDGIQADWEKEGDRLRFEEALYLYDEPNCCPCNRQTTVHRWNGSAFLRADQEVQPTYTGTPPEICTP